MQFGLLLATGLLAGILLPGCGGAASNTDNQLLGSFSGLYSSTNAVATITTNTSTSGIVTMTTNIAVVAGVIVSTNSGPAVTQLTITQSQDQIRAVDNNGDVFTGTFSIVYNYGGTIQMNGQTGGGVAVQITGYLEASGAEAWLTASWIEPNLTGDINAIAQITPFSPTNSAVWTR